MASGEGALDDEKVKEILCFSGAQELFSAAVLNLQMELWFLLRCLFVIQEALDVEVEAELEAELEA